jgi:hypothetical protein
MQAEAQMPTSSALPPARGTSLVAALGWLLVALALLDLGYELWPAIQSGTYRVIPLGELWYCLDAGSLNLVQAVVQRHLHPLLWQPVLTSVLQWPAWSLLGGPGLALVLAFSARREARC